MLDIKFLRENPEIVKENMKKKLVSALMCATMAVTMLAGCGNGSKNGTEAADGGTEAAESEVVTNTYGDSKGTHLEMWTFVELHA